MGVEPIPPALAGSADFEDREGHRAPVASVRLQNTEVRYHSLDAARATMMLLGLVLHSAASFTTVPLGDGWPYQDLNASSAFPPLIYFIHLFRMPTFRS